MDTRRVAEVAAGLARSEVPWLSPILDQLTFTVSPAATATTLDGDHVVLGDSLLRRLEPQRAAAYLAGVVAAVAFRLIRGHGTDNDAGSCALVADDVARLGRFIPLGATYDDVAVAVAEQWDYRYIHPAKGPFIVCVSAPVDTLQMRHAVAAATAAGAGHPVADTIAAGEVDLDVELAAAVGDRVLATTFGQVPTYSRLDRYSDDDELIFPGHVESPPTVGVAVDVSESVSPAQAAAAVGCVEKIAAAAGTAVRLACVTDQIVWEGEFTGEVPTFAGGGTDMRVAYQWASQFPAGFVITDGDTSWPADPQQVMALVTSSEKVPVPFRRVAPIPDTSPSR